MVMAMTQGIGAALINDEKRAHLRHTVMARYDWAEVARNLVAELTALRS